MRRAPAGAGIFSIQGPRESHAGRTRRPIESPWQGRYRLIGPTAVSVDFSLMFMGTAAPRLFVRHPDGVEFYSSLQRIAPRALWSVTGFLVEGVDNGG